MFIFLEICSLNLFYSKKPYLVYSSFVVAGLATVVRYEGILLMIPLSIIFFLKYKPSYKSLKDYLVSVGLFVITILPTSFLRIINNGRDGIISHTIGSIGKNEGAVTVLINSDQMDLVFFQGFFKFVVYLAWIAFPIFVILIPLGIFQILKIREKKILELLLFSVFLSITAIYAYIRDIQEIRYLFVLLPIFCIVSSYSFYGVDRKKQTNLLFIVIVIIVFSSTAYLEWQKTDYEIEREKFEDAKFIINNVQSINSYEGGKYLKPALLSQSWPQLLALDENKKTTHNIERIPLNNFDSIDQIMQDGENLELTHLIVFDNNPQTFLNDIYYNESKYSFLTKIYDSSLNHKQPIKIFKIDYEKFRQLSNVR